MPRARTIHLGSKEVSSINPKKEPLTIEKFKELLGLHGLSDEEAEGMVESIHKFAKILYDLARKNQCLSENH